MLRSCLTVFLLILAFPACRDRGTREETLPPLPPPVTAAPPPPGPQMPVRRLTLAYVGEVRGEIDPCGCPTLPYGGFERRSVLLRNLRAAGPLIHLDAGQLLVRGFSTGGRGSAAERARLVLDLSRAVGVDAWAPGSADILTLSDLSLKAADMPPMTSATWHAAGARLASPFVLVERGGVRVAVVGLSNLPPSSETRRSDPSSPKGAMEEPRVDPVEAVREALALVPPDVDLVVGLSNLDEDTLDRVVREVPGIPVILGTRGDGLDEPRTLASTLVLEIPNRGRYVGVLHLRLASDRGQPVDLETAEDLSLHEMDLLQDQVSLLSSRPDLSPAQAEKSRAQLLKLQERMETAGAGRNLAWWESVPLGSRYDGDPEIRARIDAFKKTVLKKTQEEIREQQERPDRPTRYVSGAACVTCHSRPFARWSLTAHARAWQSLVARNGVEDPECVTCHATGFALPGGWATLSDALVRQYKAVQCEACHGPLEGHPKEGTRPRPITEETCLPCHDEANSPSFDFESYLPRATCSMPQAGTAPVAPSGQE